MSLNRTGWLWVSCVIALVMFVGSSAAASTLEQQLFVEKQRPSVVFERSRMMVASDCSVQDAFWCELGTNPLPNGRAKGSQETHVSTLADR